MAKILGKSLVPMKMTADDFAKHMQNPDNWKLTQKVSYEIWAHEAVPGTKLYNHLEDADYETSEKKSIVLSGTRGEQWPVTSDKLTSVYTNPDGSGIDIAAARQSKDNDGWMKVKTKADGKPTVYAIQLPAGIRDYPIDTSWGETLYANSQKSEGHGTGDYILAEIGADGKPNFGDMRVVNHDVFCDTYDVSMFPDEVQGKTTAPEVPKGYVTREGVVSIPSLSAAAGVSGVRSAASSRHDDLMKKYGNAQWDDAGISDEEKAVSGVGDFGA